MQITLSHPTDVGGFRAEANRLLAGQVAPEGLVWLFQRQIEMVALHRDPGRFALLWRLVHERVQSSPLRR